MVASLICRNCVCWQKLKLRETILRVCSVLTVEEGSLHWSRLLIVSSCRHQGDANLTSYRVFQALGSKGEREMWSRVLERSVIYVSWRTIAVHTKTISHGACISRRISIKKVEGWFPRIRNTNLLSRPWRLFASRISQLSKTLDNTQLTLNPITTWATIPRQTCHPPR